jgi:hypothetical protein
MKAQKKRTPTIFDSIWARLVPKTRTILQDVGPLTAEDRAELEAFDRAWPDRIMKRTTPQQRARIRQLARRLRNPVDEQVVKKVRF